MMGPREADAALALIIDARARSIKALDALERGRAWAGNTGYLARIGLAQTIECLILAEETIRKAIKGVPV